MDDLRCEGQGVGAGEFQALGFRIVGFPHGSVAEHTLLHSVAFTHTLTAGASCIFSGEALGVLQGQGSFVLTVVVIGIGVEDTLLGPRESSSSLEQEAKSVRPTSLCIVSSESIFLLTTPVVTAASQYHKSRHPKALHLETP